MAWRESPRAKGVRNPAPWESQMSQQAGPLVLSLRDAVLRTVLRHEAGGCPRRADAHLGSYDSIGTDKVLTRGRRRQRGPDRRLHAIDQARVRAQAARHSRERA